MKELFYKEPEFTGFTEQDITEIKSMKEFYALETLISTLSYLPRDTVRSRKFPLRSDGFRLNISKSNDEIDIQLYHEGDGIKHYNSMFKEIPKYYSDEYSILILRSSYIVSDRFKIPFALEAFYRSLLRVWAYCKKGKYTTSTGEHYSMPVNDLIVHGYTKTKKEIDDGRRFNV